MKESESATSAHIPDVREHLIQSINDASQRLGHAYQIALKANPLAGDVPAVKKILQHSKELNQLLQEVSKLRF
jgi:hypothetical protein